MLNQTRLTVVALSLAVVSTLVSVAAVAIALKAQASRNELSVRRLAIVGDDGIERVILGAINAETGLGRDTGAYIQVLNDMGAPVAGIVNRQHATDGISEPVIYLSDDHANVVASLEAGRVVDTSRTPRLWMDGGAGHYSQLIIGISTGDALSSGVPSNIQVPAAGYPLFQIVGPSGDVVFRAP